MDNFVIYGEKMSQKRFAIWLGENHNKAIIRLLYNKGWDADAIVEFTGFRRKFVDDYIGVYSEYLEKKQ